MSKLTQFDLISNSDIFYNGTCTLRHATIEDIKKIGFLKYNEYLNILHLDVGDFNEQYGSNFDSSNTNVFDLLINDRLMFGNQKMRDFLIEALSFFIVGDIFYEEKYQAIKVCGNLNSHGEYEFLGIINRNNYQEITSAIFQMNFIKDDDVKVAKNTSKKAKSILEKLRKGRANLAKSKSGDSNINIPNMISSIVAFGNNYNYENIWSLTIYQLHDLFFRLNVKTQLDITGVRWAAWGKDDFDFSVWYKDPTKK